MQAELQNDLKGKYPAFLDAGLSIDVGDGWHSLIDEQFAALTAEVPIHEDRIWVYAIGVKDGQCLVEFYALPDADRELAQLFENACSDVWWHSPLVCESCGRRSGVDGYLRPEPARVRCDECDQ